MNTEGLYDLMLNKPIKQSTLCDAINTVRGSEAWDSTNEKCIASGMDAYMSKPYTLDELYETLLTWIDQSKKEDNEADDLETVDSYLLEVLDS